MTIENSNNIDYEKVKEQYKMAIGTADKTTDRRYSFNRLMILVVGGLLAAIATLIQNNTFYTLPIAIVGILVCVRWEKQINCFKSLIKIKYNTVKEIEKDYPNDIRDIYTQEDKERSKYKENDKFNSLLEQEKSVVRIFKWGFILYLIIIIAKILIIICPALMFVSFIFN